MEGQRRGVNERKKPWYMSQKLDLFVTVLLLEESPAVRSLGKLCEDTNLWTSGQKPHLTNGKRIDCNISTTDHS